MGQVIKQTTVCVSSSKRLEWEREMAKPKENISRDAEVMFSSKSAKWEWAVQHDFVDFIRLVSKVFFDGKKLPHEPTFYKTK